MSKRLSYEYKTIGSLFMAVACFGAVVGSVGNDARKDIEKKLQDRAFDKTELVKKYEDKILIDKSVDYVSNILREKFSHGATSADVHVSDSSFYHEAHREAGLTIQKEEQSFKNQETEDLICEVFSGLVTLVSLGMASLFLKPSKQEP